jgi:hypothetical protein
MRILAALLVLVAAFALVAAGCGGDDEASEDSAVSWANDFCGAVEAWTAEVQAVGESLGDPTSLSLDALREAGEDVSAATETFVDEVRGLGRPDTESGEEVESSVQALADSIDAEKAKLEDALEDVDSLSEALTAASAVGASLQAMAASFQSTYSALQNADAGGELETAFEQAEACDEISTSG